MEKQNNNGFESSFQQAFDNAEVMPSPALWGKIESGLEKQKSSKYKKRLFVFQLVAAASFALAMTVGGMLVIDYYEEINNSDSLAFQDEELVNEDNRDNSTTSSSNTSSRDAARLNDENMKSEMTQSPLSDSNSTYENAIVDAPNSKELSSANKAIVSKNKSKNENALASGDSDNDVIDTKNNLNDYKESGTIKTVIHDTNHSASNKRDLNHAAFTNNEFSDNSQISKIDRIFEFLKTDAINQIDPKMISWVVSTRKNVSSSLNSSRGLWSGINMAAGSFSPNNGNVNSNFASIKSENALSDASNFSQINMSEESSGMSFSIGMNVGTTLNDRFVLLGGLNYQEQITTNTSNITANSNAISSLEDIQEGSNIEIVENYKVTNTYKSVALPVQFGYYLVKRRFGVLLLGGISNDVFLKKISVANSKGTSEFNSSNEGYTLYSLGTILGTQFSYQIGDNYSIAIQPQYKKQLTTFTPQEILPSGFELGVRLNYMFR